MNKFFKDKPLRVYLDNQIYFVTSKTFNNQLIFEDKKNAETFLSTLKFLEHRKDFELYSTTLLPDHFHLMIMPLKKNISEVLHDLKSYTTAKISEQRLSRRGVEASAIEGTPNLHIYRRGFHASPLLSKRKTISIKIWQRSFYYHLILSEKDFENHFNYIYYNAVKHGYISAPEDWPYLLLNDDAKL